MPKKVSIQMKDQVLNGRDSISVINFLAEFKLEVNSSRVRDGAAVWIF